MSDATIKLDKNYLIAVVAQWQSIRLVNERSVVRFHIVAKHQRTGIILQTTPCPCITFHYALSRLVTPTGSAPPSNHSKAQQHIVFANYNIWFTTLPWISVSWNREYVKLIWYAFIYLERF